MQPRYVGVAGLGFLGRGIAICFARHGFEVIALEPNPIDLPEQVFLASSAAQLAHCEIVVETITEDFSAKQALYDELEQHLPPNVPITSNTSALPITLLQGKRKYPNRFAGMHWSPPAESTVFMEIIRGDQTDDATITKLVSLAKELGKEPAIVQKDIAGFVANRLAYAMYREALYLLEIGVADMETIDLLAKQSLGLWTPTCGPFQWMDKTGGPLLYAKAMETIFPTLSNAIQVPNAMRCDAFYPKK